MPPAGLMLPCGLRCPPAWDGPVPAPGQPPCCLGFLLGRCPLPGPTTGLWHRQARHAPAGTLSPRPLPPPSPA